MARVAAQTETETPTRRALPGWAVDRIHDGVPPKELKARGSRAVYGNLISTAMAAIQAGHGWPEWHAEITSPTSRLGQQSRLDGRRRDIGARRHLSTLLSAWTRAGQHIADNPAHSAADVQALARALADRIRTDPWTGTTCQPDRLIYLHAVQEAERRGIARPVLPVRGITDATGIPIQSAARGLARLVTAGLLELVRPGRHAAGGSGQAAIYRVPALSTPISTRYAGLCPTCSLMSHSAQPSMSHSELRGVDRRTDAPAVLR